MCIRDRVRGPTRTCKLKVARRRKFYSLHGTKTTDVSLSPTSSVTSTSAEQISSTTNTKSTAWVKWDTAVATIYKALFST